MNEGVALQQLADVLPPPAPDGYWIAWFLVLVVVTAAAGGWWRMRRRRTRDGLAPAHEARRRLRALRDAWQSQSVADRDAAYRLANLLRLGLRLPQLTPERRPATVADAGAWERTLTELHALRYRRAVGSALSARCFDLADEWLATAQREAR